jgi:ribonuclease P protein component
MGVRGARPHSFPKSARLRVRAEYLAVKEQGKNFAEGPLAASWRPRLAVTTRPASAGMAPALARVGLTVSSKVGDAVVRNQVKRRLREAVRLELSALPAVEVVLVARASSKEATVSELRAWLRRAARRMAGPPLGPPRTAGALT